jgi:tellurite resistance protein
MTAYIGNSPTLNSQPSTHDHLLYAGSTMNQKKGPNTAYLEEQAGAVQKSLPAANQSLLFEAAVEAGYLTALADGSEDEGEREALVEAIEILSKGLVLEWEVEPLIDKVAARVQAEGSDARCASVGKSIKELDGVEAALLIGAVVAHATGGIDKKEAGVLEKIATAAGFERKQIAAIVKKARG